MQLSLRVFFLALVIFSLAACTGKETRENTVVDDQTTDSTASTDGINDSGPATVDPLDDPESILSKRIVLFDFDQSVVKAEYQDLVAAHAEYLASHATAQVTLEGHADERGTREYNMGLGERRGFAVEKLLLAQGVSASQINVVSYGEERPMAMCHDDSCWYQNRRVEIVYTSR